MFEQLLGSRSGSRRSPRAARAAPGGSSAACRRCRLRPGLLDDRDRRAYPKAQVDGIDLDDASIAAAQENLAGSGVEDRVTFHNRDAADAGLQGQFDFVYMHESLHDMSYPTEVLRACRGLLGEGGLPS
jgi:SAM-dependent methyltransferase